jgi:hypothetical protein
MSIQSAPRKLTLNMAAGVISCLLPVSANIMNVLCFILQSRVLRPLLHEISSKNFSTRSRVPTACTHPWSCSKPLRSSEVGQAQLDLQPWGDCGKNKQKTTLFSYTYKHVEMKLPTTPTDAPNQIKFKICLMYSRILFALFWHSISVEKKIPRFHLKHYQVIQSHTTINL